MRRKALRFDILSIFPGMFSCYLDESMIKRACSDRIRFFDVYQIAYL